MADPELIKKYNLKPGGQILVLNAPAGFVARLADLPAGVVMLDTAVSHTCDLVQLFVQDSQELARYFDTAVAALKPGGALWIAYPKKSAGIETDLTRDEGWQQVYAANLEGVSMIAIDDTWSAVRFAPALTEEEKIRAQYKGKEQLWPIYEQLTAVVRNLDSHIQFGIRKTYVSLQKGKQFGVIQPTTKTRLDVGLKLPGVEPTPRLQPAGSFGSGQVTHQVALTTPADIDAELTGWLRQAYEGVSG
jgi:hypothetical protein